MDPYMDKHKNIGQNLNVFASCILHFIFGTWELYFEFFHVSYYKWRQRCEKKHC